MSSQDDIKKLIRNHARRLQKLKEEQALKGINATPELLIEIEGIKEKIEELQGELDELEVDIEPIDAQPSKSAEINTKLVNIKNSIQQGNLENSITQLRQLTTKHTSRFHNEVILHAADLRQVRENERRGIAENTQREIRRIVYALLDLIDDIGQELKTK